MGTQLNFDQVIAFLETQTDEDIRAEVRKLNEQIKRLERTRAGLLAQLGEATKPAMASAQAPKPTAPKAAAKNPAASTQTTLDEAPKRRGRVAAVSDDDAVKALLEGLQGEP